MYNENLLLDHLVDAENLKLKPYVDSVGKLSIGIGRNLDDRGITVEEAFYLCRNNIKECKVDLDKNLPWWRKLDNNRQIVILDMCFNMGITKLLKFVNTLNAMKNGRYEDAAKGMENSLWYKQTKRRAVKLVKVMRTGIFPWVKIPD